MLEIRNFVPHVIIKPLSAMYSAGNGVFLISSYYCRNYILNFFFFFFVRIKTLLEREDEIFKCGYFLLKIKKKKTEPSWQTLTFTYLNKLPWACRSEEFLYYSLIDIIQSYSHKIKVRVYLTDLSPVLEISSGVVGSLIY